MFLIVSGLLVAVRLMGLLRAVKVCKHASDKYEVSMTDHFEHLQIQGKSTPVLQ